MRTVWKYQLGFGSELTDGIEIDIPHGARILMTGVQGGSLTLWAEVNSDSPTERRRFCLVGTGFEVPPSAVYLGTVYPNSAYVFHVYERPVT
jgi:hypothetical protein